MATIVIPMSTVFPRSATSEHLAYDLLQLFLEDSLLTLSRQRGLFHAALRDLLVDLTQEKTLH